jgi:prepilin-type N-terminal cleavage/methylation domain-containing protein
MSNQIHTTNRFKKRNGFSITEVTITAAIVGTLSSIAYPNYIQSQKRAQCSNSKATMMSIPPIISAYIDATGEAPTTWDELSSIAVVMTSNGPATGALNTPIKLPRTNYELSIEGPSESTYSLTANCYVKMPASDSANSEEELAKDAEKYKIRSCFNISNGASDLTKGSGIDPANTPNCG